MLENIRHAIRTIPDFPKPGIQFRDITTLLLQPSLFQETLDVLAQRYKNYNIDAIAALESRGFIFGAPLAVTLNVPFVPIRKRGKLPGSTHTTAYDLEYGQAEIEMHIDALKPGQRVLLVDDLIATGGTLKAAIELINKAKAHAVEAACVIELTDLAGRAIVPCPVHSLISF